MEKQDNFVAQFDKGFRFGHEITPQASLIEKPIHIKHSHPRYEMYYLISGDVTYHVAGQEYHINEGDLAIVNAYVLHDVDVNPVKDYERYVLEFMTDNVPVINGINPMSRFFNTDEFICIIPKRVVDESDLPHILRRMERSYDPNDEYRDHVLYANITLFAVEVAKLINKEQHLSYNYMIKDEKNTAIINSVIQYINSHISEDISVDDIAKAVGFSKSYLQHMFKDIVGTTISQYQLVQKMQMANFLIQSGEPLQKIAADLGFKYYPTFSVAYKKFFGHSPKK